MLIKRIICGGIRILGWNRAPISIYYPLWLDKGITNVSDVLCGNNNGVRIWFLPKSHKRKCHSLIKSTLPEWFENSGFVDRSLFETIVENID